MGVIIFIPVGTSGLPGDTPGDAANSFESISKNLESHNNVINYSGKNIDTIVYDLGGGQSITKTFSYSGNNISTIALSGDVPPGISTTKTFGYTGNNLTSITYS